MPFVKGKSGNPMGKKPGTRNKATLAREAEMAKLVAAQQATQPQLFADAHSFLVAVYMNEALPMAVRLDAAGKAVRFERPALSASHYTGDINHVVSIADQLARARRKDLPGRSLPTVIEMQAERTEAA